jgi:hypothetical protein
VALVLRRVRQEQVKDRTAQANKNARIAWVLLACEREFDTNYTAV